MTAFPSEDEYVKEEPCLEFDDADADRVATDVRHLTEAIDGLETSIAKAVDYLYATGGLDHLADTLDVLRSRYQRLARLAAWVESKTAQLGREQGLIRKGTTLPDGRRVEFKGGKERKDWDVDRVLALVTSAAINRQGLGPQSMVVDPATGETLHLRPVVEAVREDLVAVLPPGKNSMRVTHMKELGLNPDDFCQSSKARVTVCIVPAGDS